MSFKNIFFKISLLFKRPEIYEWYINKFDNKNIVYDVFHKSIITTEYAPILVKNGNIKHYITAYINAPKITAYGVALPFNDYLFKDNYESIKNKYIMVQNIKNKKRIYCKIVGVGPWQVTDYEYIYDIEAEIRPHAEKVINKKYIFKYNNINKLKIKYQNRSNIRYKEDFRCNGAGLDIFPQAMKELTEGKNKKILVDWCFIEEKNIPEKWLNKINNINYKEA